MEKTTQRFKVSSLRMHNSMNELLQRIKAKKERIEESGATSPEEEKPETAAPLPMSEEKTDSSVPEKPRARFGFLRRFKKEMRQGTEVSEPSQRTPLDREQRAESRIEEEKKTYAEDSLLYQPITRRIRHEGREGEVTPERESIARPMVSETAVQPEKERSLKRKRTRTSVTREEALISRIAMNPKDFTSYEALGDYYLEMENIKDAKECYRQVLKLSPVHRMVKIKIRRLEKLLTREGE